MKAVILDAYTCNPGDLTWEPIEKHTSALTVFDHTPKDQIIQRAKEAEILFTNKTPLDALTLAKLPNLKYIGVLATGYNVVDLSSIEKKHIALTNVPGYGTDTVVQHIVACMFHFANNLIENAREVATKWPQSRDFCYCNKPIVSLAGKTLGIIGYGSIAKQLAKIALALGMQVKVTSNYPQKDKDVLFVPLETLLASSDFVSLNRQLTEHNHNFLGLSSFKSMQPSAYFINTARGPLVNEEDLAFALNNGYLAGAALDVLATEPPKPDNPLFRAKNCIITPHVAWAAKEAREKLIAIAGENLKVFLNGDKRNRIL